MGVTAAMPIGNDELEAAPPVRAVAPEAPSFASIFEQFAPYVWRALRRLGVPEADAEDQCQEVFVVVHRRLRDFEGRSSIKTWLYGICVRVASDFRDKAHVRHEQPTASVPEQSVPPAQHDAAQRRQTLELLDAILAGLDADKRAVFVLYEFEGLTMNEVAEAVGCPLQTAYSRLHAARKLVQEAAQRIEQNGAVR